MNLNIATYFCHLFEQIDSILVLYNPYRQHDTVRYLALKIFNKNKPNIWRELKINDPKTKRIWIHQERWRANKSINIECKISNRNSTITKSLQQQQQQHHNQIMYSKRATGLFHFEILAFALIQMAQIVYNFDWIINSSNRFHVRFCS